MEKPIEAAAVDIYIPKGFRLNSNESARLWLDLGLAEGAGKRITVTVGDQAYDFSYGKPPLNRFYYSKPTYRIFSTLGALDNERVRYWSHIPFAP